MNVAGVHSSTGLRCHLAVPHSRSHFYRLPTDKAVPRAAGELKKMTNGKGPAQQKSLGVQPLAHGTQIRRLGTQTGLAQLMLGKVHPEPTGGDL